MAEKDKVEKILEDYNDVFADIYNTLLFREPYLKEDQLYNVPYKVDTTRRRDCLKC